MSKIARAVVLLSSTLLTTSTVALDTTNYIIAYKPNVDMLGMKNGLLVKQGGDFKYLQVKDHSVKLWELSIRNKTLTLIHTGNDFKKPSKGFLLDGYIFDEQMRIEGSVPFKDLKVKPRKVKEVTYELKGTEPSIYEIDSTLIIYGGDVLKEGESHFFELEKKRLDLKGEHQKYSLYGYGFVKNANFCTNFEFVKETTEFFSYRRRADYSLEKVPTPVLSVCYTIEKDFSSMLYELKWKVKEWYDEFMFWVHQKLNTRSNAWLR